MEIPIVLPVVDDHGKHLSHSMIHTLGSTVAVGVVGARGNFANAKELVEGIREVGAELLAIVGEQAFRTAECLM